MVGNRALEKAEKSKVLEKAYLGSGHHPEEGPKGPLLWGFPFVLLFCFVLRQNLTRLLWLAWNSLCIDRLGEEIGPSVS